MASTSLYQICRLCMAVLDRDAIDCSTNENCELRENIEMMYSVKIKSTDEFTTKICGRCSDIVVTSTMWYIRVLETQTNIQAALRLRNDINDSLKKSNSLAGKKRPRCGMQTGPCSKRVRTQAMEDENDENSGCLTRELAKIGKPKKPRFTLSPKKSFAMPATAQNNNRLISTSSAAPMSAVNFELFQLQQTYTKPMQISNLSNINLNNNKYLLNRQLSSQSSSSSSNQHLNSTLRIQNEFSPKKKVINSFTAAEIMKRIVVPPVGGNASRMARATNSLFNVANDLYKHSTTSRGKVKTSTIVELTRKMSQLRLSGLRGYGNDIWSRVWLNAAA